jgi:hypothetical protein
MKFTKKRLSLPVILLVLIGASDAIGQNVMYEPQKGTPERTAVLGAIKSHDIARNKGLSGQIFDVTAIRIHGNWAFVSVERTNLPDAGQGTHLAFLQKTGTAWKVVWSDFNDNEEVGVSAITRLRKKNKDWSTKLGEFAMTYLAG